MDQRLAARPKPRAELHLTPNGPETRDVKVQVNKAAEQRIAHLKERLEKAKASAKSHYAKARMHGKARADFDRGR